MHHKIINLVLFASVVALFSSIVTNSDEYQLLTIPKAERDEYKIAQNSADSSENGDWVTTTVNPNLVTFVDLGSINYVSQSSIRAKTIYVFSDTVTIDDHQVKIALRDAIFNCKSNSTLVAYTVYFDDESDYKNVIIGHPISITMPKDSIGEEELKKICNLRSDIINTSI